MTTIWRIWVTASLLYLLLGRHAGGLTWSLAKGVNWCVETGEHLISWDRPMPHDIVITPCNRSGVCRD